MRENAISKWHSSSKHQIQHSDDTNMTIHIRHNFRMNFDQSCLQLYIYLYSRYNDKKDQALNNDRKMLKLVNILQTDSSEKNKSRKRDPDYYYFISLNKDAKAFW